MLEQNKALGLQEELQIPEGRVRIPEIAVQDVDKDVKDDTASVTSRNLSDFEEDDYAAVLRCEHLSQLTHFKTLPDNVFDCSSAYLPLFQAPNHDMFASQHQNVSEYWYKFNGLAPGFYPYYPLKKDARPMTQEEMISFKDEVRAAKLKELSSWVKQRAGKPVLKADYRNRTGLSPIPSRWVEVWKIKQGQRIIRIRLVLKGFAEQNQQTLQTTSPTATRIGHRLVYSQAARAGWEVWSIDVSSAFLRGYKFDELQSEGFHHRQPVAFTAPEPELFALLAELDPQVWSVAAKNPSLYCIEVDKGAYGLKDAPLLWYLKLHKVLTTALGLNCSKHDVCMYYKFKEQINLMFTLHIDDTLITGTTETLSWFAQKFEEAFEGLSIDKNHFRHCGVDVYRNPTLHHIYCDQTDYLTQLEPIDLKGRGKADNPSSPDLVTSFRSLVSGIAWLGVTFAPAAAGASLFQSFLPIPTIGQCHMLNNLLEQLKEQYAPLIYHHGVQKPNKIVVLSDSSFANSAKHSQGGYYTLLANESSDMVCGLAHQLSFRSSKSKRVASSTSHAETLALLGGVEEALFIQTWLWELDHPGTSTLQIIDAKDELVPIIAGTDCHDLFDCLVRPAFPTPANKSQTLYLAALREMKSEGRISAFIWHDTRDCLPNALTKLRDDGTLELDGDFNVKEFYETCIYEPLLPFSWNNSQLVDPIKVQRNKLPPALPPTKSMQEKAIKKDEDSPTH
jgi:hypothetical protein